MPLVLKAEMTGDLLFGERAIQALRKGMTVMRRNVGRQSEAALKVMIPVRTGKTRDATYFRSRETADGFEVDVGVAQRRYDIFQMLVHGTPAHPIIGNPLLVFFWEKGPFGPMTYFFRSVNHPGFKSKINMKAYEAKVERISQREAFLFGVRFEQEVG
jgi:hypothetical protein